jgi:peptidoglycan/LPS O-acetylase OafA/YrhL
MKPDSSINRPSEGSVHLDAIRGAAALLVFANHTRALYFQSPLNSLPNEASISQGVANRGTPPPEMYGEIKFASEAVILFFVLSGYLVGGSVLRLVRSDRWSWRVYLTKRIVRLYVVLIPAIVIGVGIDYLGLHLFGAGSVYTQPPGMSLGTAFHLVDRFRASVLVGNALFLEGILVPFPGTNVSIWSLVNEFWYYLAFPLIVLAWTSKQRPALRLVYALGACALLAFVGLHIAILFPIWILGAIASYLPRRLSIRNAKILSALFTVLLLAGMIGVRLLRLQTVQAGYLIGVLTSLLIWALVQQTAPSKDGIYKAVSGFFSRISYTLYLFHLPLAMFACGLINSPWRPWSYSLKSVAGFLAIDAMILVAVYGIWSAFEANTNAIRYWVFERERPSIRTSDL